MQNAQLDSSSDTQRIILLSLCNTCRLSEIQFYEGTLCFYWLSVGLIPPRRGSGLTPRDPGSAGPFHSTRAQSSVQPGWRTTHLVE